MASAVGRGVVPSFYLHSKFSFVVLEGMDILFPPCFFWANEGLADEIHSMVEHGDAAW